MSMPTHVFRFVGETIKKNPVIKETEKAYSCAGGKAPFTVVKKDAYMTLEEATVAWTNKWQAKIDELETTVAKYKALIANPPLVDESIPLVEVN